MESVAFLEALVGAYSPSTEERSAAEVAVQEMERLGFRDPHIDEAGNAVGFWGKEGAPRLLLLGHIDTVPGEIEIRRESIGCDEVLYGRGTVDAKGPFATFVQAVGGLPKDHPYECMVVGAVEEEVSSSKGARFIADTARQPDLIIIGEPSGGDGITLGYKGRLIHELRIRREMDHSASASRTVGDLFVEWGSIVQAFTSEKNGETDRGFATLDEKVQRLEVSNDGFHEVGLLQIGFRLGPEFDPHDVEKQLAEQYEEWRAWLIEDGVEEVAPTFYMHEVPAVYSKKGVLPTIFRQAIRKSNRQPRHVFKTGTADMNVLAAHWDTPMIAYGPGDSSLDHTPNEHISLSEYTQSIETLRTALSLLCEKLLASGDPLAQVDTH